MGIKNGKGEEHRFIAVRSSTRELTTAHCFHWGGGLVVAEAELC